MAGTPIHQYGTDQISLVSSSRPAHYWSDSKVPFKLNRHKLFKLLLQYITCYSKDDPILF
jgi:hypothetical protein